MASRALVRPNGRRTGRASRSARPTSCTSAASSRAPSRVARMSSARPTGRRSRTPAGLAQGRAGRGAVGARRAAGWAARTAMNRGQILYRVAELMEGRRDQFAAEVAAAEGLGRRGTRPVGPGHRPLGLVRRLGRQDQPGPGRSTRSGRRTSTSPIPEPTGVVGVVAPSGRRCSAWCRGWRRCRGRQRRGRARVRDAAAARDHAGRGARHVRRAGRGHQHPHGPRAELVPVLAAHMDVNALDGFGVPDDLRVAAEVAAAD